VATSKIIAVMGATGSQGGGLCSAISTTTWRVRVPRDYTRPEQGEGQPAAHGAEVVAPTWTIRALKRAFAGAHGVFSDEFLGAFSGEKEKAQAKNMADAARAASLQHVIWSTLEDTRELMSPADKRMPMLQGNYRVPHFDAKAEADAYFEGLPVTYLITSFYWDNLYAFGLRPKKEDDGSYSWTFPMGTARLAGIAAEDIGKVALGIFNGGARYIGKRIAIAGEHLTMSEMAEKLSKALGISMIKYNAVEPDAYRSFGFPGADEMGNMVQVYRDFEKEVVGIRSVPSTRELNPQLLNFDAWLAKYGNRIAI
jgi:uncharacterized protein YbjT (DUF2867 family)